MDRPIRRLGIVNRGEPAVRALTAVADLNQAGGPPIRTVVLYTDPDADAWYVRQADEAVSLGTATFVDPADGTRRSRYLDEPAVIAALRGAEVDAVWVGWGFLAEHASFAQACEEAGITFVGPDSATIRRLGDKVAAKLLAEQADVPVVPWSRGPVEDVAEATKLAAQLGYPLMVKAAAGGGGRGIRMVRDDDGLAAALPSARAEAALSVRRPDCLPRAKLVAAARHVEVQVIADAYGTAGQSAFETAASSGATRRSSRSPDARCSTRRKDRRSARRGRPAVRRCGLPQRRHGGIPASTRERAVQVHGGQHQAPGRAPGHRGTTGLDLVKLQLHVARGGRLTGRAAAKRGHAIEARLNAEDPERGFAPAPGRRPRCACRQAPGCGSTPASEKATGSPLSSTR